MTNLIQQSLTKSQMMRRVASGKCRETFTHSTLGMFDITAARAVVREMRERGERPHRCRFADLRADPSVVVEQSVMDWLITQREVDMARVAELSPSQINEPVIHAVDPDGSHYPVDGIHRMVRRAQEGREDFRYWAIPLALMPRPAPGVYADVPWGLMDVVGDKLVNREKK